MARCSLQTYLYGGIRGGYTMHEIPLLILRLIRLHAHALHHAIIFVRVIYFIW